MALFPFGKRRDAAAAPATPAEVVQRARTRARRRLIGAVVLLGIGVVGFPLLFETQPRPIAVDVDFDIPQRETAPPLAMPDPAGGSARATGQVAAAPAPALAAAEPAQATQQTQQTQQTRPQPQPPQQPLPQQTPPQQTPPQQTPPQPAAAGTPGAADAPVTQRFVVQVGAFADRDAVQQMRARVERLGLSTYTQVVETAAGARTRVRVGPFASREEADRAAGRLRAAGVTAVVLRL